MTHFVNSLGELLPEKPDLTLDQVIEGITRSKIYLDPDSQHEYSTALAADIQFGDYFLSVRVWQSRPKFVQDVLRNKVKIFNKYDCGWIIRYKEHADEQDRYYLSLDKSQLKPLYQAMETRLAQQD